MKKSMSLAAAAAIVAIAGAFTTKAVAKENITFTVGGQEVSQQVYDECLNVAEVCGHEFQDGTIVGTRLLP